MNPRTTARRNLFLLIGLIGITALVVFPSLAFSDTVQTAIVATVASDYSAGAHSVIDVDPVGGPRTTQNNLLATVSDIMVAAHENYFYRIERYMGDNVTKFDIAAPDTVVYQYSVLDSGDSESANVHAMVFASSEKAYLLRYGKSVAWIVNPSATTETEFKIGELDLSSYADDDGIPEMESGIIVDGILYITLQRLDRNNSWAQTNTAYVALIDTATDTEIDTGVSNSDGVKGIALQVRNPSALAYLEGNDTIYVQGAGNMYTYPAEYTGGIETIDPSSYATSLIVDDSETTGNISGMALVSVDKGYLISYAGWGNNTLFEFSPTTGTIADSPANENLVGKSIAGMQSGAYVDQNEMLWVCNQTDATVTILDTTDNSIDEAISTSLNPSMIAFTTEGSAGSGSGSDDGGGGCFIQTLLGDLF